jgi:hypothetical protein
VWAAATLPNGETIVVRELAFPCALLAPEPTHNYTTHTQHILQRVSPDDDLLNLDGIIQAPGLRRPVGCATTDTHLIVADAGGPDALNRILVYSLSD